MSKLIRVIASVTFCGLLFLQQGVPRTSGQQRPSVTSADSTAVPQGVVEITSDALTVRAERASDEPSGLVLSIFLPECETRAHVYRPLAVEVVDESRRSAWLEGNYATATRQGNYLLCTGDLKTPHGTRFSFEDRYSLVDDTCYVQVRRRVSIASPSPHDIGFTSRFGVRNDCQAPLAGHEVFSPGIWYRDNNNVPPMALGSDLTDDAFLFREDRLPLPMVMLREKGSGFTLALIHKSPDARTFNGEDGLGRIIDDRMQFGSLGIVDKHRPGLTFVFPGSEGEKTYIEGPSDQKRWALRSHPVRTGIRHEYVLLIDVSQTRSFPEALSMTWKRCYSSFAPSLERVNLDDVYLSGISVLNRYWTDFDGVPGFPFSVSLPDGNVKENSLQMGFVGQQIAAAHHLIRFGLENDRPSLVLSSAFALFKG